MMSGVALETCWAFNKLWNNEFYYNVVSCWLFLLTYTVLSFCRSLWCSSFHWLEENINSFWMQICCSSGMRGFPSTLHLSLEKRRYRERKWRSNPPLLAVVYKTWDAKYMFYYICSFILKTKGIKSGRFRTALTLRLLMSYIYIYTWSTYSWCF